MYSIEVMRLHIKLLCNYNHSYQILSVTENYNMIENKLSYIIPDNPKGLYLYSCSFYKMFVINL